jgi:excisionase family DNA binding protein
MDSQVEPELLTFAQVAAIIGVDVHTIERNVRADQIPVVRIGRERRVPKAWPALSSASKFAR